MALKRGFLALILAMISFYAEAPKANLVIHAVIFYNQTCIYPHNAYHYKVCRPINLAINKLPFTIPQGFDTDLASIPRIFWPLVSPAHSKLMAASILHDYLYSHPAIFNRKQADEIFYQALVDKGVCKIEALTMYDAVRLFGSSHFNKNDK